MGATRSATGRGGFGHGGLLVPIAMVGFVAGLLVVLLRPSGTPPDGSSWWWVDRITDFVFLVGGAAFAAAAGAGLGCFVTRCIERLRGLHKYSLDERGCAIGSWSAVGLFVALSVVVISAGNLRWWVGRVGIFMLVVVGAVVSGTVVGCVAYSRARSAEKSRGLKADSLAGPAFEWGVYAGVAACLVLVAVVWIL